MRQGTFLRGFDELLHFHLMVFHPSPQLPGLKDAILSCGLLEHLKQLPYGNRGGKAVGRVEIADDDALLHLPLAAEHQVASARAPHVVAVQVSPSVPPKWSTLTSSASSDRCPAYAPLMEEIISWAVEMEWLGRICSTASTTGSSALNSKKEDLTDFAETTTSRLSLSSTVKLTGQRADLRCPLPRP